MALAAPGLARMIWRERQAVRHLHDEYDFDLVVSDNRYGCRVEGVPSAIMIHQLHLPLRVAAVRWAANAVNHRLLAGFDEVLVPDWGGTRGLAGGMSAAVEGLAIRYLGPVSRFGFTLSEAWDGEFVSESANRDLAIVLSGPEPQRTLFETALLRQLVDLPAETRVTLVRGLPWVARRLDGDLVTTALESGVRLTVHDFLAAADLGQVLAKADVLVVRSGYTTVMDLAALGRLAIYVPTPGQPEQEALAASLEAAGRGIAMEQSSVSVPGVLAKAVKEIHKLEWETRAGLSPKPAVDTALRAWAHQRMSALPPRSVNIL